MCLHIFLSKVTRTVFNNFYVHLYLVRMITLHWAQYLIGSLWKLSFEWLFFGPQSYRRTWHIRTSLVYSEFNVQFKQLFALLVLPIASFPQWYIRGVHRPADPPSSNETPLASLDEAPLADSSPLSPRSTPSFVPRRFVVVIPHTCGPQQAERGRLGAIYRLRTAIIIIDYLDTMKYK